MGEASKRESASLLQSLPTLPGDPAYLLPCVAQNNEIKKIADIPFAGPHSLSLYPTPVLDYWDRPKWEVLEDPNEAKRERDKVIERLIRPAIEKQYNKIIEEVVDEVEGIDRVPMESVTIKTLPTISRRDVVVPMVVGDPLHVVEELLSLSIAPTLRRSSRRSEDAEIFALD